MQLQLFKFVLFLNSNDLSAALKDEKATRNPHLVTVFFLFAFIDGVSTGVVRTGVSNLSLHLCLLLFSVCVV